MKSKAKKKPAPSILARKSKPVAGNVAQGGSKPALSQPAGDVDGEDDFEIVIGDPELKPGTLTVRSNGNPVMQTRTDFNMDYFPLDGGTRRGRREMLAKYFYQIGAKKYMRPIDPDTAAEFRRQEHSEIPYVEAFKAMYGSKAGWRESLLIEAEKNDNARKELGWILAAIFAHGDKRAVSEWTDAMDRVLLRNESGPANRKRAVAVAFVLNCWHKFGGLPTQAQVRDYLKAIGFDVESGRKNEARDFFTGPILGTLPKGKAGRRPINHPQKHRRA